MGGEHLPRARRSDPPRCWEWLLTKSYDLQAQLALPMPLFCVLERPLARPGSHVVLSRTFILAPIIASTANDIWRVPRYGESPRTWGDSPYVGGLPIRGDSSHIWGSPYMGRLPMCGESPKYGETPHVWGASPIYWECSITTSTGA